MRLKTVPSRLKGEGSSQLSSPLAAERGSANAGLTRRPQSAHRSVTEG